MKKATTFDEIGQALRFNESVGPEHEFYTDFSGVRGEYQKIQIFRALGVEKIEDTFTYVNSDFSNNVLLFLGGMRGSGKTSELAKYRSLLHNKNSFNVVTCNIDKGLSLDDMEFMDILIFMLEQLTQNLKKENILIDEDVLSALQRWFSQKVDEINRSLKSEIGIEVGAGVGIDWLVSMFSKIKMGLTGTLERKKTIRSVLRNNFNDFALIFNNYILETEKVLREQNKAKKILFIIDGLEKTNNKTVRRKIVEDESDKIQQIEANVLFTLPIELMNLRQQINQFATVVSFPFIKIIDRNGNEIANAIKKLKEFVLKRLDISLFEDEEMIKHAILMSGGSPRELLKILDQTYLKADREKGYLDKDALKEAIDKMANITAHTIKDPEGWDKLKQVIENNNKGLETGFDETIANLLENIILMEYNDGSFKKLNPIIKRSNLYKQKIS